MVPSLGSKQIGLIFLILGIAAFFAGLVFLDAFLKSPLPLKETATVEIRQGMTGREIGELLQKNGVINSVEAFRWALWFKGAEENLRLGTIRLEPGHSYDSLIRVLQRKSPLLIEVQIPEGWPSWKIFSELSRKLKITREGFKRLFRNQSLMREYGINSRNLEGYLFPDTYYISADATHREVIRQLLDRFREVSNNLRLRERAQAHDFSLNEAVTLGSIIEKEVKYENERHLVSAVFHNRLQKGLPLQADPTVLYSYKNFNITLTESMLQRDHPYNTYQRNGLPPGAICNPGRSSLQASVSPADVPYLYFVAKEDGHHKFSETLSEHREAVHKYQR